jgi:hypothetical protein
MKLLAFAVVLLVLAATWLLYLRRRASRASRRDRR